ncbi:MAG: ABC transporter permease [Elusimicrobiota bacterium]
MILSLADYIGKSILDFFRYCYDLLLMLFLTLKTYLKPPSISAKNVIRSVIYRQIIFTAIDALPLITVISLGLGIVVIVSGMTQLANLGAVDLVGKIIVLVFVREMGPLITAFMVISRSGSAMATELGSMKITKEIESLEIMGIDIAHYILAPRLISCTVSTVLLTIYFIIIALLGGYLISALMIKISFVVFMNNVLSAFTFQDVIVSIVKSLFFGITIALISCYHGLEVENSTTQMPPATSNAIVNSIVLCVIINGIVTIMSYL